MVWAPAVTQVFCVASMTWASEVMAGKMAMSLEGWLLTRGRNSSRKAMDSWGVLYIFQLAAIRGLRMRDQYSIFCCGCGVVKATAQGGVVEKQIPPLRC